MLSRAYWDIISLENMSVKSVEKFFEKIWKKVLTKVRVSDIIVKLSRKSGSDHGAKSESKKFWKKFKKGIDKGEAMWYNRQALARERSKLDNWTTEDRSTKQICKCEYKICQNQREHNSKKVKKARINSSNRIWPWKRKIYNCLRVWSWLRMNAGGVHNTFKSNGEPFGGISGGRVSNAWATCPCVGDNSWKRLLIPHNASGTHVSDAKDLLRKDGLALD